MKKFLKFFFGFIAVLAAVAGVTLLIIKYFDVIVHAIDKLRDRLQPLSGDPIDCCCIDDEADLVEAEEL